MQSRPAIDALRAEIRRIEGRDKHPGSVLPFGLLAMDARLPGGGLAHSALHEVAGDGHGTVDAAAAATFVAGIAARIERQVLWCLNRADLYPPALAQAGLSPDKVVFLQAGDDQTVLACLEEGLRHGGLGLVIGETARLPMTVSRRLQLAAEASGTMGIALRRWRRQTEASDFGQPTAAATRWRVSALPSSPLPVAGVGPARWLVELVRARAGESADFEVEACDDTGHLRLPAAFADRSVPAAGGQHRAAS